MFLEIVKCRILSKDIYIYHYMFSHEIVYFMKNYTIVQKDARMFRTKRIIHLFFTAKFRNDPHVLV